MNLDVLGIFSVVLFLGLLVGEGSKKIKLPQVVGFIIAGLLLGPTLLNVLNPGEIRHLEPITNFTLAVLGYTIGVEMEWSKIKSLGKSIAAILVCEAFLAFGIVFAGVWLITGKAEYGLIFGSLASATAPAGTVDIVYEYKAKGPLVTTLFAVTGLDDAVSIFIFAFSMAYAKTLLNPDAHLSVNTVLLHPLKEISLAIAIGAVLGFLFVILSRKMKNKIKLLILTLSFILACAGISTYLNISLILMSMTLGFVYGNFSRHNAHKSMDHINEFVPPIYILFFAMVGAQINLRTIGTIGWLTWAVAGAFMILRFSGKYLGATLGAWISKAPEAVRKYLGFTLLSQAGVAIGLAMISANEFSGISRAGKDLAMMVILVIAITTFIIQIIAPPLVKFAIFKAGEAEKQ